MNKISQASMMCSNGKSLWRVFIDRYSLKNLTLRGIMLNYKTVFFITLIFIGIFSNFMLFIIMLAVFFLICFFELMETFYLFLNRFPDLTFRDLFKPCIIMPITAYQSVSRTIREMKSLGMVSDLKVTRRLSTITLTEYRGRRYTINTTYQFVESEQERKNSVIYIIGSHEELTQFRLTHYVPLV